MRPVFIMCSTYASFSHYSSSGRGQTRISQGPLWLQSSLTSLKPGTVRQLSLVIKNIQKALGIVE